MGRRTRPVSSEPVSRKECRAFAFGRAALWTNKEVEAKYKEQIIELQSGISYSFRKAFNSAWDPIVIEGCADSALNLLRRTTDCEIELNFTTSRKGLEALREGKCELAGFNFPKSSTNNSKAFGTFGHLLTKNNGLIFFATRLQGLAVAPGNPKKIYSILDIASRKAKFINRRKGRELEFFLIKC